MNQSYAFWSLFFLVLGVPLGLFIKAILQRRRRP